MIGRLTRLSARARVTLVVALLAGVAGGASLAFDGREGGVDRAAPGETARIGPGRILRGPDGKPLRGPDGRPLRVAADGRTIVDSSGRPVMGGDGRPLRLGARGKLPNELVGDNRRRRLRAKRRRPARPITTAKTVEIGVAYPNPEGWNAILERFGLAIGNMRAVADAVAAHVNATGGIAGGDLRLVPFEYNYNDGRPYTLTDAEICAFFRERRPLAVVDAFNWPNRCVTREGIPYLANQVAMFGRRDFAEHPRAYAPGSVAVDRFGEPYVQALKAAGFLERGSRIGLLYLTGQEPYERAASALKSALRSEQLDLVAEQPMDVGSSSGAVLNSAAAVISAVVRFRAARVDRVLAIDIGGGVRIFMSAAEAQGYRPLYGLNSTSTPAYLLTNAPREQLRGAVGIGWAPLLDVAAGEDPNSSANWRECNDILARAGIAPGARSMSGAFPTFSICDSILLLRDAVERSGRASAAGVASGLEGAGGSASALSLATSIDSARRDGSSGYRLLRFNDGCGCFRYEGPTRVMP